MTLVQDVISTYGADTVRLHMLFKAPPDFVLEWDTKTIQGSARWLQRLWSLAALCETSSTQPYADGVADKDMRACLHKTIQQVQILYTGVACTTRRPEGNSCTDCALLGGA